MAERLMATVTCGDVVEARRIGRELVEKGLAACVQMLPEVESVYRWKGEVETAREVLLLIKTSDECWERLVAAIEELHSYKVPEILAVQVVRGALPYLEWMDAQLSPRRSEC
jgi:periplasmic divalent cation tolerance protein